MLLGIDYTLFYLASICSLLLSLWNGIWALVAWILQVLSGVARLLVFIFRVVGAIWKLPRMLKIGTFLFVSYLELADWILWLLLRSAIAVEKRYNVTLNYLYCGGISSYLTQNTWESAAVIKDSFFMATATVSVKISELRAPSIWFNMLWDSLPPKVNVYLKCPIPSQLVRVIDDHYTEIYLLSTAILAYFVILLILATHKRSNNKTKKFYMVSDPTTTRVTAPSFPSDRFSDAVELGRGGGGVVYRVYDSWKVTPLTNSY